MKIFLYNHGDPTLHGRAVFDGESFTLCNEPLTIEIESGFDNLYGVCSIGNERKVIRIRDGRLTIPPDFLAPGILSVTIQQAENGKVIRRWVSERITLHKLDDKYELIPELSLLRDEIATLKKALKELYNLINKNNQI